LAASACSCWASFGVVDPHQHRVGVDVLAAHDGHVPNASVYSRGDVESRRVDFPLYEQGLAAHQVPD
jgi:hypothetical protein